MSDKKTIVKITLTSKNNDSAIIDWWVSPQPTGTPEQPTKELILILSADCEIEIA